MPEPRARRRGKGPPFQLLPDKWDTESIVGKETVSIFFLFLVTFSICGSLSFRMFPFLCFVTSVCVHNSNINLTQITHNIDINHTKCRHICV